MQSGCIITYPERGQRVYTRQYCTRVGGDEYVVPDPYTDPYWPGCGPVGQALVFTPRSTDRMDSEKGRLDTVKAKNTISHEEFVQAVRQHAVTAAAERGSITAAQAAALMGTKVVYGVGRAGIRGVCYYGTWKNGEHTGATVEVSAATQENFVQLAGTTVHELAHVLAGHTAGHDNTWKDACVALGFTKRPEAAGQVYRLALFGPTLRVYTQALAQRIADGSPAFSGTQAGIGWLTTAVAATMGRPCGAGYGTRGGTSRGAGSGSRQRKYTCTQCGQIIRAATDTLSATHDSDGGQFQRAA